MTSDSLEANKQATTWLKAKVSTAWSIGSPEASKDKQVQGALKRHEDYGRAPRIGESLPE